MTEIDLSPIIGLGIELLAALALALGSYGIYRLNKWLGIREDSEIRAYLNGALHQAVEYGRSKAAAKGGKATVKTENELVAAAAGYALAAVPDALAHFKVTPERLEEMIRARLGDGQGS